MQNLTFFQFQQTYNDLFKWGSPGHEELYLRANGIPHTAPINFWQKFRNWIRRLFCYGGNEIHERVERVGQPIMQFFNSNEDYLRNKHLPLISTFAMIPSSWQEDFNKLGIKILKGDEKKLKEAEEEIEGLEAQVKEQEQLPINTFGIENLRNVNQSLNKELEELEKKRTIESLKGEDLVASIKEQEELFKEKLAKILLEKEKHGKYVETLRNEVAKKQEIIKETNQKNEEIFRRILETREDLKGIKKEYDQVKESFSQNAVLFEIYEEAIKKLQEEEKKGLEDRRSQEHILKEKEQRCQHEIKILESQSPLDEEELKERKILLKEILHEIEMVSIPISYRNWRLERIAAAQREIDKSNIAEKVELEKLEKEALEKWEGLKKETLKEWKQFEDGLLEQLEVLEEVLEEEQRKKLEQWKELKNSETYSKLSKIQRAKKLKEPAKYLQLEKTKKIKELKNSIIKISKENEKELKNLSKQLEIGKTEIENLKLLEDLIYRLEQIEFYEIEKLEKSQKNKEASQESILKCSYESIDEYLTSLEADLKNREINPKIYSGILKIISVENEQRVENLKLIETSILQLEQRKPDLYHENLERIVKHILLRKEEEQEYKDLKEDDKLYISEYIKGKKKGIRKKVVKILGSANKRILATPGLSESSREEWVKNRVNEVSKAINLSLKSLTKIRPDPNDKGLSSLEKERIQEHCKALSSFETEYVIAYIGKYFQLLEEIPEKSREKLELEVKEADRELEVYRRIHKNSIANTITLRDLSKCLYFVELKDKIKKASERHAGLQKEINSLKENLRRQSLLNKKTVKTFSIETSNKEIITIPTNFLDTIPFFRFANKFNESRELELLEQWPKEQEAKGKLEKDLDSKIDIAINKSKKRLKKVIKKFEKRSKLEKPLIAQEYGLLEQLSHSTLGSFFLGFDYPDIADTMDYSQIFDLYMLTDFMGSEESEWGKKILSKLIELKGGEQKFYMEFLTKESSLSICHPLMQHACNWAIRNSIVFTEESRCITHVCLIELLKQTPISIEKESSLFKAVLGWCENAMLNNFSEKTLDAIFQLVEKEQGLSISDCLDFKYIKKEAIEEYLKENYSSKLCIERVKAKDVTITVEDKSSSNKKIFSVIFKISNTIINEIIKTTEEILCGEVFIIDEMPYQLVISPKILGKAPHETHSRNIMLERLDFPNSVFGIEDMEIIRHNGTCIYSKTRGMKINMWDAYEESVVGGRKKVRFGNGLLLILLQDFKADSNISIKFTLKMFEK